MNNEHDAPYCGVSMPGSDERVLLGHGAGTRLTQQLLLRVFLPAFDNDRLNAGTDSAVLSPMSGALAFTTDSYVVNPLFFPGGNIGALAVCGTVNDLAMVGAMPVALSASFIIEEGFLVATLQKIVTTMADLARDAGVSIVTGDTKVVEKGKADGLFITTSGVGECLWTQGIGPASIVADDVVILSGDVGRHSVAVLAARQGFVTSPVVESDVTCLHYVVAALHKAGIVPHCLRDLTRGGLGAALWELSEKSGLSCEVEEQGLPLKEGVKGVVEALGLDPWFLANEGRFIVVVPPESVATTIAILKLAMSDIEPVVIGRFTQRQTNQAHVIVKNEYGTRRFLRLPLQEPLPRIC